MSRISHFFVELHRRRVIKASVAYLVVAWLLIEVSSLVFPALLLPDWTHRLVVILALAAFPVVVILAWVFDISPSGIVETDDLPDTPAGRSALMPPPADSAIASICVLPFDVLSSDDEDKFIAQGVGAEISSALSKLQGVRVVVRASIPAAGAHAGGLGAHFDVQYMLTGSLRRQGDKIRIIVELADARSGSQLWSETYDRVLDDIMEVEEAIARAIVGAFGGEQLRAQIEKANQGETKNPTAWSLVYKARSHILSYSQETLDKAEACARKAIELDPGYALAHAALADVLCERISNGLVDDPREQLEESVKAIEAALAKTPDDPFVLKLGGNVWKLAGQHQTAIECLKRAVAISPFDLGAWGYLASALAATDNEAQLAEADDILNRILEMAPQHPGAGFWWHHRALAATCKGDYDSAVALARRALQTQPRLAWTWYLLANALANFGDENGAREALSRAVAANANLTPGKFADVVRRTSATAEAARRRLSGLAPLELD